MRTNLTGRMNRDTYYDDFGGGHYSSPEHIEQPYVDQRSWFEKLWDKTPVWIKAFVILLTMCLVTSIVCGGLFLLCKVLGFLTIITVSILGILYLAIYHSLKNS